MVEDNLEYEKMTSQETTAKFLPDISGNAYYIYRLLHADMYFFFLKIGESLKFQSLFIYHLITTRITVTQKYKKYKMVGRPQEQSS